MVSWRRSSTESPRNTSMSLRTTGFHRHSGNLCLGQYERRASSFLDMAQCNGNGNEVLKLLVINVETTGTNSPVLAFERIVVTMIFEMARIHQPMQPHEVIESVNGLIKGQFTSSNIV